MPRNGLTVLTPDEIIEDGPKNWSETERETAYFIWRTTAGRNLKMVSKLTGIPYPTLDDWKRKEAWPAKADEDDKEWRLNAGSAVTMAIQANVLPSIITAVVLRDDPQVDPKTRLTAAQWLAGIGGFVPAQRSELEIRAKKAAVEAKKYDEMSDSELAAAIGGALKSLGGEE